ncbi:MAG: hypothetical protein EOP00_18615 [Pedobacter sp.]|nr:MAG: hypothetical protein EOP00_18615 [Pedobacter sp.]
MKNSILLLYILTLFACNNQPAIKQTGVKNTIVISKPTEKEQIKPDSSIQGNTSDSKVFNQCDPNCIWQYYHPFADTTYVFAVQNCGEEFFEKGKTARVYFGIDKGLTDKIIWAENVYVKIRNDFMEYKDFNGDGIKDILIFYETGSRSVNSFYHLYLVDAKHKKINRIRNFENIVNPEYHKIHKVIIGYGYAGTNNYTIYKISKANKVYQIGESFEDDFDSDQDVLDTKITQILKENKE